MLTLPNLAGMPLHGHRPAIIDVSAGDKQQADAVRRTLEVVYADWRYLAVARITDEYNTRATANQQHDGVLVVDLVNRLCDLMCNAYRLYDFFVEDLMHDPQLATAIRAELTRFARNAYRQLKAQGLVAQMGDIVDAVNIAGNDAANVKAARRALGRVCHAHEEFQKLHRKQSGNDNNNSSNSGSSSSSSSSNASNARAYPPRPSQRARAPARAPLPVVEEEEEKEEGAAVVEQDASLEAVSLSDDYDYELTYNDSLALYHELDELEAARPPR